MSDKLLSKFLLLQINDAFFPIGAYVHSYGLETYVEKGLVCDVESAQNWLMQYIAGAFFPSELFAVRLAYEGLKEGDMERIFSLEKRFLAARAPMELRQASVKLGNRFVKIVQELSLPLEMNAFKMYVQKSKSCAHPVVYGVFCAAAGIGKEECLYHYLYAQAAALVTTCVKTVPLAQTAGQQILQRCSIVWPNLLKELSTWTEEDFCLSVPGFDIRAMQHENLYSRLYMS